MKKELQDILSRVDHTLLSPDRHLGGDQGHLRRRREVRLRQRLHPGELCPPARRSIVDGKIAGLHGHRLPQRLRHHGGQVLRGGGRREKRRRTRSIWSSTSAGSRTACMTTSSPEIRAVKDACGGKLLKVIIETLSPHRCGEDRTVPRWCPSPARTIIKTSTGFGGGGATREDVALFKPRTSPRM